MKGEVVIKLKVNGNMLAIFLRFLDSDEYEKREDRLFIMADLVSVVVAIGNGAESHLQQLFFPLYAPLPYS